MAVSTEALKGGNIAEGIGIGGFNFGSLGTILIWGVGILVVLALFVAVLMWWLNKKAYVHQIWIFKKVGGVPIFQFMDRGKLQAFGMAGDRLLVLKKLKKFLPPPTIQMGKNIFWFWERADGELINFSLEDIDEAQRKVGAYFVDTDMRMQRLGIEKNLRERMERKSFFEKYGATIAGIIFVIMVTVALVVLFSKLTETTGAIDNMAGSVNSMASKIELFYESRVGGESPADVSGLTPALIPLALFRRKKKWQQRQ